MIRITKTPSAFALLSCVLFFGCATSQDGRLQDSREYRKAAEVFGGTANLYFFFVPSSGPMTDAMVSGLTAAHPSAMAKQLGGIVGLAQKRKVDLAVTGSSQILTRTTVISGLKIHQGEHLPQLRVLYIGTAAHRDAVAQAVRDAGGEFFFVERSSL